MQHAHVKLRSTRLQAAAPDMAQQNQGWMLSPAVARRFGIKTGTLNKWRQQDRGPKGWKRVSRTVVAYPVSEVLKFEQQWGQTGSDIN